MTEEKTKIKVGRPRLSKKGETDKLATCFDARMGKFLRKKGEKTQKGYSYFVRKAVEEKYGEQVYGKAQ